MGKRYDLLITFGEIFDVCNHSANGFNEQSHDNGLSFNDKDSSDRVPLKAFRATIDISFPSNRSSSNDGNGITKSDVNALN